MQFLARGRIHEGLPRDFTHIPAAIIWDDWFMYMRNTVWSAVGWGDVLSPRVCVVVAFVHRNLRVSG